MKQRSYSLKDLLLTMLKYFVIGLGYTLALFFEDEWAKAFISFAISFYIVVSLKDYWKRMRKLCSVFYILSIPFSALCSGFMFGFALTVLNVNALSEYQNTATLSIVLATVFLLCGFAMIYFLKSIWNLSQKLNVNYKNSNLKK